MNNVVHIHKILHFIIEYLNKKILFTEKSLKLEIVEIWGKDVKFTSCSENIFGIEELINFLKQRDKIFIKDEIIFVNDGVEDSECLNS